MVSYDDNKKQIQNLNQFISIYINKSINFFIAV